MTPCLRDYNCPFSRTCVRNFRKKIERIEAKSARPPTFLAGELCAPEQSCRTASRVLSRMSSIPFMSSSWQKYNDILTAHVTVDTDQDRWFLEGNAVQVRNRCFLHDCFVAPDSPLFCSFSLVSLQCLVKGPEAFFSMKVSSVDVCGKVTGAKNGVECMKPVYVFTLH
jgi:hypothetical protein